MSNTRKAEESAPFREEKWASSAEFDRGLMANLVAKRCTVLEAPADRDLIWFLQLLSHAPGGLEKVATDLLAMFPERVATRSMQKFGFKPGQIYNAEQVRAIREELKGEQHFPLKGELSSLHSKIWDSDDFDTRCLKREFNEEAEQEAKKHPANYPASVFTDRCHSEACKLPELLREMCLNPAIALEAAGPFWFPTLIESLREFQARWIEARGAGRVTTELGRQVDETLDYCLDGRCLVLIDGLARTGKTHAAKAWVESHPGQARYVQVPSGSDDIGFFRAIAAALGVSINLNSKAQQLRDRVEDVLQTGQLALILDEAHYAWPQSNYRDALPGRVNWIMTALVNHRVPVALVTTPQFMRSQTVLEKKTHWTGEQFTGRIGHYQKLPDSLAESDLVSVARALLPEGCAKCIETLVCYAQSSTRYVAGIETAVTRARFLARKAKRDEVIFADVKSAIKSGVIPSDKALQGALEKPARSARSRTIATPAPAIRAPLAAPPRADNLARNRTPELHVLDGDPQAA